MTFGFGLVFTPSLLLPHGSGVFNKNLASVQQSNKIFSFQKNWEKREVSNYLIWLPIFDIEEVTLSQKPFPMKVLATAIKDMLAAEKFDFTELKDEARIQLFALLNSDGTLKEPKNFQDNVWGQIKNHQNWKAVERPLEQLVLESIKK